MISIGLMSGTSMDGIDAAILETDGNPGNIIELGHTSIHYDPSFKILLKAAEFAIKIHHGDLQAAEQYCTQAALKDYLMTQLKITTAKLDEQFSTHSLSLVDIIQQSTQLHADVVTKLLKQTNYKASQIDVIGYHGQAMYHQPDKGISIILGDGQALANCLNIHVVNDFRSQDVAAGGQGAPFAPLYHQALAVRDNKIPLAVVNCGGIANVTFITNDNEFDLIGFDTGPGNALIDSLIRQRTQGAESMDADGKYGNKGKINETVLHALYSKAIVKNNENYFATLPPKSLDYGDIKLIDELGSLTIEDACATLAVFTAESIINSIDLLENMAVPTHWVLAGGGWQNPVIFQQFKHRLQRKCGKQVQIYLADQIGWNSQAMEAQIFAYLAVRSLQNKPLSMPGTTGVPKPMTGGRTYFPER